MSASSAEIRKNGKPGDGGADGSPLAQKLSFRFAKRGSSIFYSHHDLMRHFARALRRAALAPRLTDGFNPHPRMVFPHPLSLGVASQAEEIEIEFARFEPAEEVFARLKQAAEPVVELTGWTALPPVKRGRLVSASVYAVSGWDAAGLGERGGSAALAGAVEALLAKAEIVVMRGHESKARPLDIRPLLLQMRVSEEPAVTMRLSHSDAGTGRADEYVRLLAEALGLDWAALAITRCAMEFAAG